MRWWFDHWQPLAPRTGSHRRQRRAQLLLEVFEDRCLLSATGYSQVNLASDLPGLAAVTLPSLVNPWGISFSPTGPFWLADNGSGVSNLLDGGAQVVPLTVTVSSAVGSGSSPTGTVFNGGPGFDISANGITRPSRFLFAAEDGTISGWTTAVNLTQAVLAIDNSALGADYKGLALATNGAGQSFLYAADFGRGQIDVFDQNFKPVDRAGAFQDPSLPKGYAPFNIQNVAGKLYVVYAQQDENDQGEALAGAGLGFVDVYDTNGNLLNRFASQGTLDAPWGLALAPADFGRFGGALLVGNDGDGHINAYAPTNGDFLGQLTDDTGLPIAIPDLWALTFGNGYAGGNADTLFFTAGVDYEAHGLFGAIQPPQLRGADTAGPGVFEPNGPGEPGDYPLPPFGGPALQSPRPAAQPVSILMPLAESSLVLVPTLSTITRQQPAAAVPAHPSGVAGFNGPGAAIGRLVTSDSTAPYSNPNNTAALNTFLDLFAAPSAAAEVTGRSQAFADLDSVNRLAFIGSDAPLFTGLQSVNSNGQSKGDAEATGSSIWGPRESVDRQQTRTSSEAEGVRNTWTKVFSSLGCVIALRVAWGYLLRPNHKEEKLKYL